MTLDYLRLTGRDEAQVALVEAYAKEQGLFAHAGHAGSGATRRRSRSTCPRSSRASRARGVRRTAWRSREAKPKFAAVAARHWWRPRRRRPGSGGGVAVAVSPEIEAGMQHGAVVVAAITSCTNTSNPTVMIAAGLLAQEGRREGARPQAVGEDEPRARLAGGDRVPREGGPHAVPRRARLQPRRATAAPRASATAARCQTRSPRPSRTRGSSSPPCCRATATSRDASSRSCAPTTSRRRRSSSPTRSPGR